MRLKLSIQRHGLPPVNLVFNVPNDPTKSLQTISNLLELVNETIPLEAESWGLEDYVVELDGFECLHYSPLASTLKEDDRVTIRPLLTPEIRARHVAGRDQISAGGVHLLDGIPFGKTSLKRPSRPAIAIPPRKRARLIEAADDSEADFEQDQAAVDAEDSRALVRRSPSDGSSQARINVAKGRSSLRREGGGAATTDPDVRKVSFSTPGSDRALALLNNDDEDDDSEEDNEDFVPEADESDSSESEHEQDEAEAEDASGLSKGLTRKGTTTRASKRRQSWPIRYAGHRRIGEGATESQEDSEEDQHEDDLQVRSTSSARNGTLASKKLATDIASVSSKGSSSEPSSDEESTSSSESESTSESDSESESDSSSGSDEEPIQEKIQRSQPGARKSRKAVSTDTTQKATPKSAVPSELNNDTSKTQARNKRRVASNRLRYLKSIGALPPEATIADLRAYETQTMKADGEGSSVADTSTRATAGGSRATSGLTAEEETQREELMAALANGGIDVSASPMSEQIFASKATSSTDKRARLDVNASRRLITGSLGFRAPKTQADIEAIRAKVSKKKTANTSTARDAGIPEPLTGDDWRSRINLTAIECIDENVVLSEPPFPFYQRWDPQQQYQAHRKRGARGKKRKRNNRDYYDDGLEIYGEEASYEEGGQQYGEDNEIIELNYDDPEKPEQPQEPPIITDDLPDLPSDPSSLPDASMNHLVEDDIIIFKQLDCSEATNWAPQISEWRTATVTYITPRGMLNLSLAERDRIRKEIKYDDQGRRVYAKFEMQYEDDEQEIDDDGFRNVDFKELITPKLLQAASTREADASKDKDSSELPGASNGQTSETTWNGIEGSGETDELARSGIGLTQQAVSAQILAETSAKAISISSDSVDSETESEVDGEEDESSVKMGAKILKAAVASSDKGEASEEEGDADVGGEEVVEKTVRGHDGGVDASDMPEIRSGQEPVMVGAEA